MNTRQQQEQIYQLVNAANNGDLITVKQLLSNGVPVNGIYNNQCTALALAVQNKHLRVAEELLEWGADISFELAEQQLLWIAAFQKNSSMVKLLIKHGAPLNKIQSCNGSTPLLATIYNSDYDTAKVLIDAHCNVNVPHVFSGFSPLHLAALNGQYRIVKELIKAGAMIDSLDHEGETPLFSAIAGKSIRVITLLLSSGANINHITPIGRTALSKAHQFYPEGSQIFREEGKIKYDISQTNIINQTILYYEKMHEKFPEVYQVDYLKNISEGLCAGLGVYFAIVDEKERNQFISQVKLADVWDGNIESVTTELKDFFEKKLTVIIWLHAHHVVAPQLKKIFAEFKYDTSKLINFILDKKDNPYEQIFSIGFVFKKIEIKNLLVNVSRDNVKIFFSSSNHLVTLRKISNSQYAYDSNSSVGALMATSIDDLVEKMILMFGYKEHEPNMGLHIEAISKIDLPQKNELNNITQNLIEEILKDRKIKNEINLKDNNSGLTAVAYAVKAQDGQLVTDLIELGANINYNDADFTPLAIAVQTGNIEIANHLITMGADVNAKFVTKESVEFNALAVAVSRGFGDMVDLLLKHGADANAKLADQLTALHLTATTEENLKMVKRLIKYGASIEGESAPESFTPLYAAVVADSVGMVEILLQNGANCNYPCYKNGIYYTTPLSIAVHLNRLDILKFFVKYGADLNVPICTDVLPIHLAKNREMISYLQEQMKKTKVKTGNLLSTAHNKSGLFYHSIDKDDHSLLKQPVLLSGYSG
ncbi:MAG: ankyrin repeat domain-containing protein [Gammaproteobacteria bacterium]|nr:ankyrin repeat domain-containing protein [Gammaproteobacteria bacterium]MCW5582434.1 ankyrin repeat domain-containing protein [Gammaproteobacteria bacterium]